MSENHVKKFITGSALVMFANILAGVLNYFIRRTLAINLSIQDFGFLYGTMSLCMLCLSYVDLGLSRSANILIARTHNESNIRKSLSYFNYFFVLKLSISLVLFFFFIFTYSFWLHKFLKYNNSLPFFILLSLLVLQSIYSAAGSVFIALQKFLANCIMTILSILITLLIIIFFDSNNIIIASSAFPISSLFMLILSFSIIYKYGYKISLTSLKDSSTLKEIFHLSKWIAISTASSSTLFYMDSLMLTYLSGLNAVGIYNVVLPLAQIVLSLLVFPTIFIPIATQLWVEKQTDSIAALCIFMTLGLLYIIFPILIFFLYFSNPLIIILFDVKYSSGASALTILVIGTVLSALSGFYITVLNTGHKEKVVAILLIIASIINITLNFILIPHFNITGAATATTVSYAILSILVYFQLKQVIPQITLHIKQILYFSFIGLICFFVSLYYLINLCNNNIFYIITFFCITLIVYTVMTLPFLKHIIQSLINVWKCKSE